MQKMLLKNKYPNEYKLYLDGASPIMLDSAAKKEFAGVAKNINPNIELTLHGCNSCVHEMVSFVFKNESGIVKEKLSLKKL